MRGSLAKSEKSPFPPYSFSCLPVAQSDARTRSAAVLPRQLRGEFMGAVRGLSDLCNNPRGTQNRIGDLRPTE
jgi:hypothetical protein